MHKPIHLLSLLLLTLTATSQYPGAPDTDFGTDGHTSLNIATIDNCTAIALQSDGKILSTLVTGDLVSYLCRFNADGSVDTDFGTNGSLNILIDGATFISVNSVAVMNDDRIVAGFTMGDDNFLSYYGCARFLPNGTPDNSFSNDGFEITAVDPDAIYGGMYGITLQPDGQIISYGVTSDPFNANIILFRITTDGVFDNDFGDDGYATVSFTSHGDYPMKLVFTSDNKMLVAGYSEIPSGGPLDPVFNDVGIAKLDMDGQPDPLFGIDGIFSANLSDDGDWFKDLVLMTDGTIYAAGSIADENNNDSDGYLDFLLAKITADGNFDTTFDEDGWMRIDVGSSNDILSDLMMDDEGRLVLTGSFALTSGDNGFSIMRRMPDGTPDTDFGPDLSGRVMDTPGTNYSSVSDALIQPDGKILVGGFGNFNNSVDMILARYLHNAGTTFTEEISQSFYVYPNPANDIIYIHAEGMSVPMEFSIYDLSGRMRMNAYSEVDGGIDVHDLAPGVYVLCVGNVRRCFVCEE